MLKRFLKVEFSEISQFVIPCTQEDCSGEALIDLLTWPAPENPNHPLTIYCPLCKSMLQPPVTQLLRTLQNSLKHKAAKPLFYFLLRDP
jgi:hypothetical protein